MITTVTTAWERRVAVETRTLRGEGTIFLEVEALDDGTLVRTGLTSKQARQIAAALTADQGGQWTRSRGDLWSVTRRAMSEVDPTRKLDTAELDALASYVADKVAGHALAGQAERERDAAVERAEQAEARIEGWREAHDALMENPCPVTLDEVEKAIDTGVRGTTDGDLIDPDSDLPAGECVRLAIDAVWALVSGDDPAVHVVRESNVEAQAALRNRFGEFVVNGTVLNVTTAEDCREKAQRHLDAVARCESISRAIEAEQAVDPVEAKARELYEVGNPGTAGMWESIHEAFKDGYRRIARHVLGQEADHA